METKISKIEKKEFVSRIHNSGELVSLTDLWKEAGSINKKDPNTWLGRESTIELIDTICTILNTPKTGVLKSKRGKTGGGTWAHKNVALAYAKWLDPKLHILVNEVFFERIEEEKNPEFAIDRVVRTYEKQGKDKTWIASRVDGRIKRNFFTAKLSEHGVTGDGYKNCTNAVYNGLFGGTATVVREKKGLTAKDNIRDNLSIVELAAISLSEALSMERIEKENVFGNAKCEVITTISTKSVANAIINARK